MKRLFWSMLILACVLSLLPGAKCFAADGADEMYGVLTEERIVNLPQDQDKWHISVVGLGGHYKRLLGWFDTNANLKSLKAQVKFHQIDKNTPIYRERYATNVSGLPTVRVQKADGTVVYEASDNALPYSAEGLYGAIAGASNQAQGILRPWRHGGRPWLPWRRNMEEECRPQPRPQPLPQPPPPPDPDPFDDYGAPIFDEEVPADTVPAGMVVLFSFLSAIVGGALGVRREWKETY